MKPPVTRFAPIALPAVLAVAAPTLRAQTPRVPPPATLAFTHVAVIDVEGGRVLPDRTVLIAGNRIRGVGPSADLTVPAAARVVEARGKFLIPGLWDAHVHLTADAEPPFDFFPAFGVTSLRDVGGGLARLRLLQQRLRASEQPAPRLFYCGPELDGNPPAWPSIAIIVDTPERARGAVRFLAGQGVSCIKAYAHIEVAPLAAAIAEARARGLPVAVHPSPAATMRRAAALGASGVEHLHLGAGDIAGVELPAGADSLSDWDRQALLWKQVDVSSAAVRELIQVLVAHGTSLTPTLTTDEGNNLIADSAQAADPENRVLPPAVLRAWKATAAAPTVSPGLRRLAQQAVATRRRFVKAASEAGVRILVGSGGPWLGTYLPGLATHHEMELLVQAGLSPLEALRAATLNPARFFAADSLGTVAPGKLADLVLLAANPLEDIRNTRKIDAVVVDGRYLDEPALEARRRAVATH